MARNHSWKFDNFVDRVDELTLAPKKHLEFGFKTLYREFYFDLKNPQFSNLLKDIFVQENTGYDKPLPQGFVSLLFKGNPPCLGDKLLMKEQHVREMTEKLRNIYGDGKEPELSFEEVIASIKSVFSADTAAEAVEKMCILNGMDVVSLEYVVRILTNRMNEKFVCSKDEIKQWFEEFEAGPKNFNNGIIGTPLQPMLLVKMSTSKFDFNEKITKNCGERFLTETKFDGERLHVHKSGSVYKFYSRNGIDYSEKLGQDSSMHFAARIHGVFKDHVDSCILDGELLVWDKVEQKLVGKNEKASDGKIYDVKNLLERGVEDSTVVTRAFCVFDVLHLNGTDLIGWSLTARLKQLHGLFRVEEMARHTLFVSTHVVADSREVFLEYYNKAMDDMLEGIVVKNLYSTYKFGSRSIQDGWFKVKPDYGKHNTLDLAVIAVKANNWGKIFSFVVAALKCKEPLVLTKVGTILSSIKLLDRERLVSILRGEEHGFKDNRLPQWVESMHIDKQTRFVYLRNICVVEVRASGIMRGALRFPSIVAIRSDKDVTDIDTIDSVFNYEKSIRRRIDPNADEKTSVQKKRRVQSSIASDFNRFHSSNSDGYEICLIGVKSIKSDELTALAKIGLKFVANVTKTCQCVITEEPKSFRLKGVVKQNLQHILKPDWLMRCKQEEAVVPWKETDFIVKCPNADLDLLEDETEVDSADVRMEIDSAEDSDVDLAAEMEDNEDQAII